MSDLPTDPSAGGPEGQPSEEEMRAYLGQLRAAPVDQVLAELLSSLLNAAQVKVGRRDARLLLDGAAALVTQVRSVLPDELVTQLDQVLSQLRMAQVQAEPEVAAAAEQGEREPNDIEPASSSRPPASSADDQAQPSPSSSPGTAPSPPASGPDPASRLWVPGR
ncbi:MAG: hypothetical protein WD670_01375 [Actinomycetota bacterium]